ncbi:phage tail protein [Kosakonia sp. LAM2021]|uniref:phage tail-collar fiber domain-containing protein n=1 Tax=Kosakonia sp. LAM2021 TaxID=2800475 RepID=UPI00351C0F38
MTAKYYAILTNQGAAKLAAAAALGTQIHITQMAVGDGNGSLPTPDATQTQLLNQKRIGAVNTLTVDAVNANQVIAEQVIPENEGGYWIREMGLFDDDGVLIAIANCPETYKPLLLEGSGRTQTIRMALIVSSTAAVTLKIDPSVVLATRKYVDDKVIEVKAYSDELMKQHVAASNPHTQYAPIASPTFTGTPKAPTAAAGDNTTQLATTAFVQSELSGKQPLDATLTSIARLATGANKLPYFSEVDTAAQTDLTAVGRDILAKDAIADVRTYLGLGKLAVKDAVTSQEIFNDQAVEIGNAADLNSYTTPGLYFQPLNSQALSGANYPEQVAGSLEVYKHAGITQIYRIYADSRCYVRTKYEGVWSAWARNYDSLNKPTAADIGALPTQGGVVAGRVVVQSDEFGLTLTPSTTGAGYYLFGRKNDGTNHWYFGQGAANSDVTSWGNYLTNSSINLVAGGATVSGTIVPTSYSNFDARYQSAGSSGKPATSGISGSVLWWRDADTGVIFMMGTTASVPNSGRVTFPFAFPAACFSVVANRNNSSGEAAAMQPYSIDTTGWNLRIAGGGTETVTWFAAGK